MSNRADNFNRTDSALSMDSPSDGGSNYIINSGVWGISSNRGACQDLNPSQSSAVLECSAANGSFQVTIASVGANGGVIIRSVDDNNYFVWVITANNQTIYRRQSGSFTQVATSSDTWANGDVAKVVVDSSNNFSIFKNGTHLASLDFNDSFQSTATKHGIREGAGVGIKSAFDDLTWTDASVAFAPDEDYAIPVFITNPLAQSQRWPVDEDVPPLLAGNPDETYQFPVTTTQPPIVAGIFARDDDLPIAPTLAPDEDYSVLPPILSSVPQMRAWVDEDAAALLAGVPDEDYQIPPPLRHSLTVLRTLYDQDSLGLEAGMPDEDYHFRPWKPREVVRYIEGWIDDIFIVSTNTGIGVRMLAETVGPPMLAETVGPSMKADSHD